MLSPKWHYEYTCTQMHTDAHRDRWEQRMREEEEVRVHEQAQRTECRTCTRTHTHTHTHTELSKDPVTILTWKTVKQKERSGSRTPPPEDQTVR